MGLNRLGILAWEAVHVPGQRWRVLRDRTPPDAFTGGTRVPVVLLPGTYEPWRYLLPWARTLHAAGHPVVVLPALGSGRAPVADAAATARSALNGAEVGGGVLLGHSRGGLVGKALLLDPVIGSRLAGLVAISTPWRGSTRVRGPLRRTALRTVAAGDPWIEALSQRTDANTKITAIRPAWDEFVTDHRAPVGARAITLGVGGHLRMVLDPDVHAVILAEVARFEPSGQEG